jgi:hypothetical protein
MNAGFKVGYSLVPGWTYQWRSIQHHLTRLGEQYRGVRLLDNVDLEETVHALFLDLYHLHDWLHQDSTLQSLDKATVKTFIDQHPDSLGLCRDYANTRKHVTRTRPGKRIAQITSIEVLPGSPGFTVMIGHRPWDQPTLAMTEVDALALAEQATLLLLAGVPVHVVSQRLGHASPVVTMTVYAHVLPGNQRDAADTFARLIREASAS